jgi:hypothetical protein
MNHRCFILLQHCLCNTLGVTHIVTAFAVDPEVTDCNPTVRPTPVHPPSSNPPAPRVPPHPAAPSTEAAAGGSGDSTDQQPAVRH